MFSNKNQKNGFVFIVSIKLTTQKERVFSFYLENLQPEEKSGRENNEQRSLLNKLGYDQGVSSIKVDYSGPNQQLVFSKQFAVTFKTNKLLSKRVFFSTYFDWMGELREDGLYPIMKKLIGLFESGQWGMVTNSEKLNIVGDLRGNDIVQGCLWIEKVTGRKNGTIDLCFEWRKKDSNNHYEKVAFGYQRVTWVKITGHGEVVIEEMPKFVEDFFSLINQNDAVSKPDQRSIGSVNNINVGLELKDYSNNRLYLKDNVFQTTLENSNLVGNIYFSNYAKWLGVLADIYFYQIRRSRQRFFGRVCLYRLRHQSFK